MEKDDRRYLPILVSKRRVGDTEYFAKLAIAGEKTQELFDYFMSIDISNFNPDVLPKS